MSAASLAEYLIMKPDSQETVLHNARFSSPPVVSPHQGAMKAIRAYCSDPHRSKGVLEDGKATLRRNHLDESNRPKTREESLRCIETIELFESGENAFGLNALPLVKSGKFPPMRVEGVGLSVQPDLLVTPIPLKGRERVGAIFFRPQKAPDPSACRLEETRRQKGDHRREMAKYMLAMAQMLMESHGKGLGEFDRTLSFVADIRLGERIVFSTSDHASRVKQIKAACKQISRLWAGIEPRASALMKDE